MADMPPAVGVRAVTTEKTAHLVFPALDEETPAVAQFRLLRARLAELTPARVILVTSAVRDEGKTTVAANLALCCAEYGRARVLLVEAHFAHPAIAAAFGIPPGACFAQQLVDRHRGGARQPWHPTVVPGESLALLSVRPSGAVASAAWPAFRAALQELREEQYHELIIIDGPPALDSADANIIARECDQVILAGISGRSRTGQLRQAAEQLAPAKIGGVVLLAEERHKRKKKREAVTPLPSSPRSGDPDVRVERGPSVRDAPAVSVVIPTWGLGWLDEALDSVRAQTFDDYEIIVVDDGSPTPVEPRKRDDIVLIRQPNTGPGGARNRAFQHARGTWVALLDSDDRWLPEKLARQMDYHRRQPDVVFSCADLSCFDQETGRTWMARTVREQLTPGTLEPGHRIPFAGVFYENCVNCSTVMMRRDALARTPGMAPSVRMGEDYGLWLRLALLGPVGYVEDVLAERRMHGASLMHVSIREGSFIAAERRVYDEFLDEHPELRREPFVRAAFARLDFEGGYHHLLRREWRAARRSLVRSIRAEPTRRKAWINLARAMLRARPR